jgi:hypothetical protein
VLIELLVRQFEKNQTEQYRQTMILAQTRCASIEEEMRGLRQQLASLPSLLQLLQIKDRIIMV